MLKCIAKLGNMFKDDNMVLFGDNSRVHRNKDVEEAASDANINLMWNCPYRPDLMGIELVWRDAKKIYKQEIARQHTAQKKINNIEVVKWVFAQLKNENIKHEAACGWRRLM